MTPEKKNRHNFQGKSDEYGFCKLSKSLRNGQLNEFFVYLRIFTVTPLTPVNENFRVQSRISKDRYKSSKRKSLYVEADDPLVAELLPKPRWQINTQFDAEVQPAKRARKFEVGSTEMILQPLTSKDKSKPTVSEDIRKFRERQMYRSDIPREDRRALLRQQYKKRANLK